MIKFIILFSTLLSAFLLRANEGHIEYKQIIESTSINLLFDQDLRKFNKLSFKIRLTPEDQKLNKNELILTLKGVDWERKFNADYNGNIEMEISENLYKKNPKAYLNKTGKGRVHIGLDMLIKNDNSSTLKAKEVTKAISQYNQAISEAGFIVKMMAPKLTKIRIRLINEGICTINYSNMHSTTLDNKIDHYINIESFEKTKDISCSSGFYAIYLEN